MNMVSVGKKSKGSAKTQSLPNVRNLIKPLSSAQKRKWNTIGVVAVILLWAFTLRLMYLEQPRDFWHDEAFQYLYSKEDIGFILDSTDVHPPLFNIFTHYLVKVIDTPLGLRISMAMLSILFLILFYIFVKDMFGVSASQYALISIAFIPAYTYYSVEFRNYIFTLIFVMLSMIAFNRMQKEATRYNLYEMIWVFSSVLAFGSHYLAGLITFVQFIYLIINQKFREYAVFAGLMGALVTPIIYYAFNMLPKIQSFWFKDIDLLSLISTFSYIVTPPMERTIGWGLLMYGVAIFAIIYFRKKLDERHWLLGAYLILPVITMWIISQFIPFYHHRYFLFGGVALYALVGWSVKKITDKWKEHDQAFLGVVIMLLFLGTQFFTNSFNSEIYESTLYMKNQSEDWVGIHTTTFTHSPYRVYFPEHEHYLVTNLTEAQLYTAGGSVVKSHHLKQNYSFVDEIDKPVYYISDKLIGKEVVWDKGGLYVTK